MEHLQNWHILRKNQLTNPTSENSFNKYVCSMNVDNDRDKSHITKSSHHAIRIRTQSEKNNMNPVIQFKMITIVEILVVSQP